MRTERFRILYFIGLSLVGVLLISCSKKQSDEHKITFEDYRDSFNEWVESRRESLLKPDGWLSLAGLYWLENGPNTFGSDSTNDLIFPPGFPDYAGTYFLSNDTINVILDESAEIKVGDSMVTQLEITNANSPEMQFKSFSWYAIKRGDKVGIRLKDTLNAPRLNFTGIERFPLDLKWRLKATFIPNPENSVLTVDNIIGITTDYPNPGKLKFEIDGEEHTLELVDDGTEGQYFLIFSDETSGKTTYGGGRYMYLDKPGKSNEIILDFNKAYNPPCVFTEYATCPLPTEKNHLTVEVRAGEKNYHH